MMLGGNLNENMLSSLFSYGRYDSGALLRGEVLVPFGQISIPCREVAAGALKSLTQFVIAFYQSLGLFKACCGYERLDLRLVICIGRLHLELD